MVLDFPQFPDLLSEFQVLTLNRSPLLPDAPEVLGR
jgi:hypothetical protein